LPYIGHQMCIELTELHQDCPSKQQVTWTGSEHPKCGMFCPGSQ
jgi:hypothetical protein